MLSCVVSIRVGTSTECMLGHKNSTFIHATSREKVCGTQEQDYIGNIQGSSSKYKAGGIVYSSRVCIYKLINVHLWIYMHT